MSDNRPSRGGNPRQRRGGRRGGSRSNRESPANTRSPRPTIKPGLENAGVGAWAAFSAQAPERNAQRVAQLQDEQARVAAERLSQGLSAELRPEITETQITRGQDGSRTVSTKLYASDEPPVETETSLVNVEHPSESTEDDLYEDDMPVPTALAYQSSSEPTQRVAGTGEVMGPVQTSADLPMVLETVKTRSLPPAQERSNRDDVRQPATTSVDKSHMEQELQPSFAHTTEYPVQAEEATVPHTDAQEQQSLLKEETPPQQQGELVELPVDNVANDESVPHSSTLENRPDPYDSAPSDSDSEIISDDEEDDLTDPVNIPDETHDKVPFGTTENMVIDEDQETTGYMRTQYGSAGRHITASPEPMEAAERPPVPPRRLRLSSGPFGRTDYQPPQKYRMSELVRQVDETSRRAHQLDRDSYERQSYQGRETPPQGDDILFGTSPKPRLLRVRNPDFEEMAPRGAIRPLNIIKPGNLHLVKTAYSRMKSAKGTKNGKDRAFDIPSTVNEWQQNKPPQESVLPKQGYGLPAYMSSRLHGRLLGNDKSDSGNSSPKHASTESTDDSPGKMKKDSKRWFPKDTFAKLNSWIPRHFSLWMLYLVGTSFLLYSMLGLDKDIFPKSSLPWSQEILPLEKTSLLRAIEAESILQGTVREASSNIRANDSNHSAEYSCSKFVEEQIADTRLIYRAEQSTLAFIYNKLLPDLQATVFQHNKTQQDLVHVYNEITKASQSLTNIDHQISGHIHIQRVNSHQCANTPGLSVKAQQGESSTIKESPSKFRNIFNPVTIWIKQFPALSRFVSEHNIAKDSPMGYAHSLLYSDTNIPTTRHATPFDNHFRAIERSLQRSQRGHKGLRDELQRLDADLSLLAKSWFKEEQLVLIHTVKDWTRRFWKAGSDL